MNSLLSLCAEFFLTGLFAIGGGLATLPFLTQIGIRHPDWYSQHMLVNMIAVSESTPGPIGVNMATYVGYTVSGILGAFITTLSLVFPSVVIIILIARALERYRNSPLVNTAFNALRPVVTGLIASAAFSILLIVVVPSGGLDSFSWLNLALLAVIFTLTQLKPLKKIHPLAYILLGAALGLLLNLH